MKTFVKALTVFISAPDIHRLKEELKDVYNIHTTDVEGSYKGIKEKSVLFMLQSYAEIPLVRDLIVKYNEESALLVDNKTSKALLMYQDARAENIGYLKAISKDNLKKNQDYSKVGDKYYTVLTK